MEGLAPIPDRTQIASTWICGPDSGGTIFSQAMAAITGRSEIIGRSNVPIEPDQKAFGFIQVRFAHASQ
jgi:hypothetical protein